MRRALLAYGPALAWAAFVLFLGGLTDLRGPKTDLPVDKVAHFFMYATLGVLVAWGWHRAGKRPNWIWLLLGAFLVGAVDEIHQRGVAGRSAELADWTADVIGTLVGIVLGSRWAGMIRERGRDES